MHEEDRNFRRRFLRASAAAASALAMPRLAGAQPKLESEVVFACFGGALETMVREQLAPPFEKATGCKVVLSVGTALSNLAKIQAAKDRPTIDVYWSNELTHAAGKKLGLFAKLDPAVVKNLDRIYDLGKDADGIGVVSSMTALGIAYNKQKLAEAGIPPPTSWKDLWDPRLKGRVELTTFGVAFSQDFLVIVAKLNGGGEDNIRPGLDKIKELRSQGIVAFLPSTPAEMDKLLSQGTAWIAVEPTARAYPLADQGVPIDFVYPKEGAGAFANYFDVVRNAPHPVAAQAFVNYMLSEDAQLALAKYGYYGPINRNVKLPPDLAAKVPYGSERMSSLVKIDRDKMNAKLDEWNELWSREIEAKK
jgi:putative spermidine/putrescine transport system substrate-binding protein